MADLNKVLLIGRLTRDPELRYTPKGKPVCDVTIAINKTYMKDKKEIKETCFVDITVWNKQAESTAEYMKKGKTIFCEGELTLDKWESKEGEKRSKMRVTARSIQFLSLTKSKDTEDPEGAKAELEHEEQEPPEDTEPTKPTPKAQGVLA